MGKRIFTYLRNHRRIISAMKPKRCAVYARYSSDQQRPTSIDDQLRKCLEYAQRQGWVVDPQDIFTDEAISGVGADRMGYRTMLQKVFKKSHPVDTILVDDTSRLSRSLPEIVDLQQRLRFEGIRLIAISQGIDSEHEQAEILFAIHGIVDSLYVRELAKKTHRDWKSWRFVVCTPAVAVWDTALARQRVVFNW